MKRLLLVLGLAAVTMLLIGAVPVQAQAAFTPFTGTSTFDHLVTMGNWTALPSGRIKVRGYSEAYADVMSDARVSGIETIVMNGSFDTGFAGRMWGTSRIENGGGYWETTWVGKRTTEGFSYITGEGHGHGDYEGLKGKWYGQRLSPDPTAPWQFSGYILDPHGN